MARGGGCDRRPARPVRAVRSAGAPARPLGLAARAGCAAAGRRRRRLAGDAGRQVPPGGARGCRTGARTRCGPRRAHPPPVVRPPRAAADPGRDRALPRRRLGRGLCRSRRPVRCLAALRRALGPALDGPGALQRVARQRGGSRHPLCLALPRLPDPGLQRRRSLRSVDPRASGGRPVAAAAPRRRRADQRVAARADPLPPGRARLPAGRPVGGPGQVDRQPGGRGLEGLPGAHRVVRALPRPQVRRHQPGGLLRVLRHAVRGPAHDAGGRRAGCPGDEPERARRAQGRHPRPAGRRLERGGGGRRGRAVGRAGAGGRGGGGRGGRERGRGGGGRRGSREAGARSDLRQRPRRVAGAGRGRSCGVPGGPGTSCARTGRPRFRSASASTPRASNCCGTSAAPTTPRPSATGRGVRTRRRGRASSPSSGAATAC